MSEIVLQVATKSLKYQQDYCNILLKCLHSTNLTNHGRTQASSLDDIYTRSTMTSDSSLYDPVSRRYYDETDPVRYFNIRVKLESIN